MADAGLIRAGGAFVEILAKDATKKGMSSAEAALKRFGVSVALIGVKLGALGSSITAPLLLATHRFAESGAELKNMSTRTGLSVEALSILGATAKTTGTDMEGVEAAVRRMQKALVAGSEENVQAEATFKALGLDIQQLLRLSPDKQFEMVAKAVARIENPTARAGAAMQIFGRAGTILLPLIENLDAAADHARKFGLVVTTEDAEAAHKLHAAFTLVQQIVDKVTVVIGAQLAPLLTDVAEQFASAAVKAIQWVKANGQLIVAAFKIGAAITAAGLAFIALGTAIYGVGAAIGVVTAVFGFLVTVFTAVTSTAGTLVIGLGVLTASFLTNTDAGKQMASGLMVAFQDLKSTTLATFKGIADAMKGGDIQLAATILWAGIKLEFTKGFNFLHSGWLEWSTFVADVFTNVRTNISAGLIELWAMMQRGWEQAAGTAGDVWLVAVGAIKDAFSGLSGVFQTTLATIASFFAGTWDDIVASAEKGFIEIKKKAAIAKEYITNPIGALSGDIGTSTYFKDLEDQAAREKGDIDTGVAQKKAARETDLQAGITAREKERAETRNATDQAILENQKATAAKIQGIDATRNEQLKGLFDAADAEKAAREKAKQSGLEADKAALQDAQDSLDNLLAQADSVAQKAGGIGGAKGGTVIPEGLEEAPKAVEKAKTEVAGSFQARAIAGQGVGKSIEADQLKEQKTTNQHLVKLNEQTAKNQKVFT